MSCYEIVFHSFYRPVTQSSVAAQAASIANPFGTLPTMPQVSIGHTGTSPSVQYGISSLPVSIFFLDLSKIESMHDVFELFEPWFFHDATITGHLEDCQNVRMYQIILFFKQVVEKPVPVRISSLLTSRHLSQRRIKLPVRKYHPKSNGPKVIITRT